MTHSTDPINNPRLASLTDDEILDILHRVQSGELSVEQAEQLLEAASVGPEEQPPDNVVLNSQDFSAPLGKTANGKLVFERGAAGLTVCGEPLPGQLFTAHFERHVPVVRVNGSTVTVRYRDFGFGLLNWLRYGFRSPGGNVILNTVIPWQIEIGGGMTQSHLDLRRIRLRRLILNSGASDIELKLGEPNGRVGLDFTSGIYNISILRPASVAVRLTIRGGAANLALDDQKFGAVGGTTTLETPNSQEAAGRYVITVNGGAHNFKVGTL